MEAELLHFYDTLAKLETESVHFLSDFFHFLEISYPAWPRVQNKYLLFIVEAAIVEQETIVLWLQDKVVVSNIVPGAQVINIWCPWAQR